jgi:hypothetical protein
MEETTIYAFAMNDGFNVQMDHWFQNKATHDST